MSRAAQVSDVGCTGMRRAHLHITEKATAKTTTDLSSCQYGLLAFVVVQPHDRTFVYEPFDRHHQTYHQPTKQ